MCTALELRAQHVPGDCANKQLVDNGHDTCIGRRVADRGDLLAVVPPRDVGRGTTCGEEEEEKEENERKVKLISEKWGVSGWLTG